MSKEGCYCWSIPNCPKRRECHRAQDSRNLRFHFAYCHQLYRVAVGGIFLPKCDLCGMQVLLVGTLSPLASKTCTKLTTARRQHVIDVEGLMALQQGFTVYKDELIRVDQFKYLGCIVLFDNSNAPVVHCNVWHTQSTWCMFKMVLEKDSVPVPVTSMFYQVVAASRLLYGNKSWVLLSSSYKALDGFDVEASYCLMEIRLQKVKEEWIYPHSADILATVRLCPIQHYVIKRCAAIARTITNLAILREDSETESRQGSSPRLYWLEQSMEAVNEDRCSGGGSNTIATRVPQPAARGHFQGRGGARGGGGPSGPTRGHAGGRHGG